MPESTPTLADIAGRAVLSVEEAGRLLGLSPNSAFAAVHRGEIPAIHLGRRLVVPVPALVLRLLGAEDVAPLLAALGVTDLAGLVAFVCGSEKRRAGLTDGRSRVGKPLADGRIRG